MAEFITHACGAKWTARGAAHCAACHLTFSSTSAFDLHRVDAGCADPATAVTRTGKPKFQARTGRHGETLWGLPGTWVPVKTTTEEA